MAKNKKVGGSYKSPNFHIEFKNDAQKLAWAAFQQHHVLFLTGPAGTGKTHLAVAFAIQEIMSGSKKKLIISRPIKEAGTDRLGHLPGDIKEKTDPYMRPVYDCLNQLCGPAGPHRVAIESCVEVVPLAFMRGRTFNNAICILDEAQNCTKAEIKLFLTRMGEGSKMMVTGDHTQSDILNSGLVEVKDKLKIVQGISVVEFDEEAIVRHPIVREIVKLI